MQKLKAISPEDIRASIMDDNGTLRYMLTDHQGSTVSVLNAAGAAMGHQRYMPFGQVRPDLSGTSNQTDFGYTGQREMSSIGLMDYNARFYDPELGRFTQPDTIVSNPVNPQTWNRYGYVENNPINRTDPTGHASQCGYNGSLFECKDVPGTVDPGDTLTGCKRNQQGNCIDHRTAVNLTKSANELVASAGWDSVKVVEFLDGASTNLDMLALVVDSFLAAGDIFAAATGAGLTIFTTQPEVGAIPAMIIFEAHPITLGIKNAGNVMSWISTAMTITSDILTGETNVQGELSRDAAGGNHANLKISIGRDSAIATGSSILGSLSPVGLISAPLALAPVLNDMNAWPLSTLPKSYSFNYTH